MLIRKQLRGTGRFGYRVSKENYLFLHLGDPFMSNPGVSGVFRCGVGIAKLAAGGAESAQLQ
jgi:hypothetical protein